MTIRKATDRDIKQWINLRRQLWPLCSPEEHNFEVMGILSASSSIALLAVDDAGNVIGFIELSIRNYAEGCESKHVGYVEGIFVHQENRRRGLSRELFQAGERWALSQGCFEMGSDCEINDKKGLLVHQKAGFSEVQLSTHFRKSPLLQTELDAYCSAQAETVYNTYLKSNEPWKQSGFSGPEERWIVGRKLIADCITKPGSFLDIGCANGYLLECILNWTADRGLQIKAYGIDILEQLVATARKRLQEYSENISVGNGMTWNPGIRFDWVRTELCYVPANYRKAFVNRLITLFLKFEGVLLVAEYHSRNDVIAKWESEILKEMGFVVSETESGFWEGRELTRVSVLPRKLNVACGVRF